MFEHVKKIMLDELYEEKKECDDEYSELRLLRADLVPLTIKSESALALEMNFSFFEKFFTKRKEYRQYKSKIKEVSEVSKKIQDLKSKIDRETERLRSTGITSRFDEVMQKIEIVTESSSLCDLGISPIEAIQILEKNGIQPILTEADMVVSPHESSYDTKSSLICVHKTHYPPSSNMIKSARDSKVKRTKSIEVNGKTYEYSYYDSRDTVHFSMNNEVSSHSHGSWDTCEYAILIPFSDISNQKIGCAIPADTFTKGSIDFSENTWILCPEDEVEKIKKLNPCTKAHILGYTKSKQSVLGFPPAFLSQLGYNAETVENYSWSDSEKTIQFKNFIESNGITYAGHTGSSYHYDENLLNSLNECIAICKLIQHENLSSDIDVILKEIGLPNELILAPEDIPATTPQSIIANHKQSDVFFEEMKKNGFLISPAYQEIIKRICNVPYRTNFFDYCKNNPEIFEVPEYASKEETDAITKFSHAMLNDTPEPFNR